MLVLRFCARAFSSCGKQGPLFIAMRGPFTVAASLVAEHRLQTRRLSSCGSRAQLLCGMWDLPRPGLEPVSPALAGGLSTTAPPGKPPIILKYFSDLSQPGRVGPQIIEHCLENKISVLWDILDQGSQTFFKRTDNKYFWPWSLCHNYTNLLF